jgi:Acetyltransferase (GNAT) domain
LNPASAPQLEVRSIVPATADLAGFERLLRDPAFAEIEAYPHTGAFGRAFHPAIHGNLDRSFAVTLDGTPALVCLCAPLGGRVTFYDLPLRPVFHRQLADREKRNAVDLALSHLDEVAAAERRGEVLVIDVSGAGSIVANALCARARGATMTEQQVSCVDLSAGPAAWRKTLRKSSRSLINWGRRNLRIAYVNAAAPDRAEFDRYQAFHAEVAGRVTRQQASWDVMYDSIVCGRGELIMAYLEDALVAGSMFIDGTVTSIYASGVYDREHFDKPLAHYPMWLGMEHARERGLKTLELGAVYERGAVSEKEYQIGYFKRGFATHLETQQLWRWQSGI